MCNTCFLLVEKSVKNAASSTSEHSYYSSASPKPRRKVLASTLACSRQRRRQEMTASLASRSAYSSKYKLCFRQLLSTGKAAQRAFAATVQEKIEKELSAFIRSSAQYPTLTDTKSIAAFSWSELMNSLHNKLPVLHAALSGAMPKTKDESTYVIIITVSINYWYFRTLSTSFIRVFLVLFALFNLQQLATIKTL